MAVERHKSIGRAGEFDLWLLKFGLGTRTPATQPYNREVLMTIGCFFGNKIYHKMTNSESLTGKSIFFFAINTSENSHRHAEAS